MTKYLRFCAKCFSAILILASSGHAKGFSIEGEALPQELSMAYLEESGHQPFTPMDSGVRAPIGSSIFINGSPISARDYLHLDLIFREQLLARVPPGAQILVQPGQWQFPIGTESAHLIRLLDKGQSIFELRLVRKLQSGQWEFGTYATKLNVSTGKVSLVKNQYSGVEPFAAEFVNAQGLATTLSLNRLNLKTCANCHAATSAANYASPDVAGPCGFISENETGILKWADLVLKKRGFYPLSRKAIY